MTMKVSIDDVNMLYLVAKGRDIEVEGHDAQHVSTSGSRERSRMAVSQVQLALQVAMKPAFDTKKGIRGNSFNC